MQQIKSFYIKPWRNKKEPQRTSNITSFVSKHNREGINYPSEKDEWREFDKNNLTIALNVLYAKNEKICILPKFQNTTQIVKKCYYFNDYKHRKMAL